MIIAFDVDDVLANLVPHWLARYNRDYDDVLRRENMTEWDMTTFVKPECGSKIYAYLEASLYDDIDVLPGALETVRSARKLGRVIFATSAPVGSAGRKLQWLNDHGFQVDRKDYWEGYDKSLIHADVLIDDNLDNVSGFRGARAFLVDQPWNRIGDTGTHIMRIFGVGDPALIAELEAMSNSQGTQPGDIATKAVKYDTGKPRMELLSPWVLTEVAKVMTHGAEKYAPHNWRKGFNWTRPIGAALRHITAWLRGEDLDPEWNLPHLAHAICCLMFTLEHQMLQMGIDDRWKNPAQNSAEGKGKTI